MDVKAMLTELSGIPGTSGYEHNVAAKIAEMLKPLADEISTDRLGNVFGVKKAKIPGAKKLLIDAHTDEISMFVTKVEGEYLRFITKGIDPRVLPGREVVVMCDPLIKGVIGTTGAHLETAEQKKVPLTPDKLWIDTGISKDELAKKVRVGTPVGFSEKCVPLGENRFSGKTMDDRACAVMLMRALEILKDKETDVDVIMQMAVQEEVGGKGAAVGTFGWNPDYGIAVDVGHAKTPDDTSLYNTELGEGTPISMGPNTDRKVSKRLLEIGERLGFKCPPDVMEGGTGTDAGSIQIAGDGVATAVVSLPLRYMHTAVEVIDLGDLENGAQLLAEFALSLKGGEL